MKRCKTVLALVLALVMALGCVTAGYAMDTDRVPIEDIRQTPAAEDVRPAAFEPGETVRAIVLLDSPPAADTVPAGSARAGACRARLLNEQRTVLKAMRNMDYTLQYEFTSVLNGFSCDVAYEKLEEIRQIPGVSQVYLANTYDVPHTEEPDFTPQVGSAGDMTGLSYNIQNGVSQGEGMVIAVIDTGLYLGHDAFRVYSALNGSLTRQMVESNPNVAPGRYVSEKVPFAYDYADKDNDVRDHNGHGTHVAGIAAGYGERDGQVNICGGAPRAQIVAMKVFHDNQPGTSDDIFFAALDDAYDLGVDVVNMSIGAPNGFVYDNRLETEVYGNIFQRLQKAGILVCAAAGNEYSMAEHAAGGSVTTRYMDYGTIGSPASYEGNVSVASVNNATVFAEVCVVRPQGEREKSFLYRDSSGRNLWKEKFGGRDTAYQAVTNKNGLSLLTGSAADFAKVDVRGKIAVVSRGNNTFQEKVNNAHAAGAAGLIVVNTENVQLGMEIENYAIPAISMPSYASRTFWTAPQGSIRVPVGLSPVPDPDGYTPSDFSNWGPTPGLTMDPVITGVGGNVISASLAGPNQFTVMSGTSMACPNTAGAYANLLSYLKEKEPRASRQELAALARSLMESTAQLLYDGGRGVAWPARKQGAGLIRPDLACKAYTEGVYIENPVVELGDDPGRTGTWAFTLNIRGNDTSEVTCAWADTELSIPDWTAISSLDGVYEGELRDTLLARDMTVDVDYTLEAQVNGRDALQGFVIPAGETVQMQVKISLSSRLLQELEPVFPNGFFLEGYLLMSIADGNGAAQEVTPHASILAFCGDWGKAPVLEETNSFHLLDAYYALTHEKDNQGRTPQDRGLTVLDMLHEKGLYPVTEANTALLLKKSSAEPVAYLGDNPAAPRQSAFDPARICISNRSSDARIIGGTLMQITPYLLRNARHLIMTVKDAETGEVYYVDDTPYLSKAAWNSQSSQWESTGVFQWDGTDKMGRDLPSGTRATVVFDAVVDYEEGREQNNLWSFRMTVDTHGPVLESFFYDRSTKHLTVTVRDDHYLAGLTLTDASGEPLAQEAFFRAGEGTACTAEFDLTGYSADTCSLRMTDYAANENREQLNLTEKPRDAVVTFHTAQGPLEFRCKTGDVLEVPAYDRENRAQGFLGWADTCVPGLFPTREAVEEAVGTILTDSRYTVRKTEEHFYGLFERTETTVLDKCRYDAGTAENYEGRWAVCGYDSVEAGGSTQYDPLHPQALDSVSLKRRDVASIRDAEVDTVYTSFSTNDPTLGYVFTRTADGTYTIAQAGGEHLYLSLGEAGLELVQTPVLESYWRVSPDSKNNRLFTALYNGASPEMVLVYDDIARSFRVMDDLEPVYGDRYRPSQLFTLILYRATEEETKLLGYEIVSPSEGPVTSGPCYCKDFTDCSLRAWYHEAVDFAVANGLIQGVGQGRFAPEKALNRATMVTILYRAAGSPAVEGSADFTDVPRNQWFSDAIAWAQQEGVVMGVTEDRFAPFREVTREQLATILWRYEGRPAGSADLSAFADSSRITPYARDAISWAVSRQILRGTDDGRLLPLNSATRAQFAQIMMNYMEGSYTCTQAK